MKKIVNIILMLSLMLTLVQPVAAKSSLEKKEINSVTNYRDIELVNTLASNNDKNCVDQEIQNDENLKIANLETFNMLHNYAKSCETLNLNRESKIVHMNDGDYKYKYSGYKYVTRTKYAGNQRAEKGYRFPTGGGFYFSNKGGPSTSVSVGFPKPFSKVAFSMNFGNKVSSGLLVKVPSRKYYYKLRVKKTYKVRSYVIYRRQTSNSSWHRYSGGSVKKLYKQKQWAKRIK